MPHFDRDKLTTFEVDHTTLEFLGKNQVLRNLAGIACLPETPDEFWRHLPAHDLQHVRRCNRFGIRKPIQEGADAKEMIAVAVGDNRLWSGSCRSPQLVSCAVFPVERRCCLARTALTGRSYGDGKSDPPAVFESRRSAGSGLPWLDG